jgi:hypothetical protein
LSASEPVLAGHGLLAIPNQNADISWKPHDRPLTIAEGGSLGSVMLHKIRWPAPGCLERNSIDAVSWPA